LRRHRAADPANELASAYEVPVSQLNDWKQQAMATPGQRQHRKAEEQEAARDRLYQRIGKLQAEVEGLKNRGRCSEPDGPARGG